MDDAMMAATVRFTGHGGDEIEGYLVRPLGPGPYGGVVVIHHMPGYDAATKEITRRFAAHGYAAICPNLHYREAPGASPDDAAAAARANGGVPDDRLVGDVGGAIEVLRGLTPPSRDGQAGGAGGDGAPANDTAANSAFNGRVGVIGYCSGGRQAFLVGCSLPVNAAVDCYGAFVVGTPPEGMFKLVTPLLDRAGDLNCPLLGLFGADDTYPSPDQMETLATELNRLGKPHEFHTYEGAGHAFFAVDRPSYRVSAAVDGWQRIWDFFGEHVAARDGGR